MQEPSNRTSAAKQVHTDSTLDAQSKPTRDQQRAAFYLCRSNGLSIAASSDSVGVSRNTGSAWEKQAKGLKAELDAKRGVIATKAQVAQKLTEALDQASPQYIAPIAGALSKVMGYDAPTRSEQIVVHASVAQWIDARNELPAAPSKALPSSTEAGTPPNRTAANALSPSQNISQSEKK